MGGLFAAALAQEMRRLGEPGPVLQLLVYPAVELAGETPSLTTFADAFPLDRATLDWFVGHYLAADADPADPRLAPGRTEDLSGLPPAVIATAGFDPVYGARPLKRAIQSQIENPLAKQILEGRFGPKDVIRVDVKRGVMSFDKGEHASAAA